MTYSQPRILYLETIFKIEDKINTFLLQIFKKLLPVDLQLRKKLKAFVKHMKQQKEKRKKRKNNERSKYVDKYKLLLAVKKLKCFVGIKIYLDLKCMTKYKRQKG